MPIISETLTINLGMMQKQTNGINDVHVATHKLHLAPVWQTKLYRQIRGSNE